MTFLSRWFGGKSAEEERQAGDAHFEKSQFGDARLAYERALDRSPDESTRLHCAARISACFDAQSEERLKDAHAYSKAGQGDLARAELASAIELARSPDIRERARRAMETLERTQAKEAAQESFEMSDDERFAVIAGTWSEVRMEEFDRYGEPFRRALLALHDEQLEEATPFLENRAVEHPDAIYLWLEVARVRILSGDDRGAHEALTRFLERLPAEHEEVDARLGAHAALAAIADRGGDEEKAIEWLSAAIEAVPDDPRPFFQLGVFLRQKGHAEEAVEVLETGIDAMGDDQPSWEAHQELALALRDAGRTAEAITRLEGVIRFFVSRSIVDFPRTTALPLAELHEKEGKLERAADLYRTLANGSDRVNHVEYHRSAARVLEALGHLEESRRMLTRAAALAEKNPELLAELETKIRELDSKISA